MERNEDVAKVSESAASTSLQVLFANRYRELIGVDPSLRHELKTLLQAPEGMSVGEILDVLSLKDHSK